jgi:tetratricopeptide (TPR) repeat protein
MDARRWLAAGVVLVTVGCQAPAQVAPTATPAVPTVTPAPPTAVPPTPTSAAVVVVPTVVAAATPPAASASRVEALNAANAAFKSGNLKEAAGLYDRVANTPPGSAEDAATASAINDFAWFRGLVTLLADGREDEARANLDSLKQRNPNAPLARLADQLYNQYGMVGQLRGACAQLQPQVATQAGPALTTLQALGVTNVDAATLCSVPAG